LTALPVEQSADHWLDALDRAQAWLTDAADFATVKDIRDKAEVLHAYAQTANCGRELANRFAELRIRAERKAGQMLGEVVQRGRPKKTTDSTVSLEDLGVSKFQSRVWQRLAQMHEDLFESALNHIAADGELTTVGVLRCNNSPPPERSEPPGIVVKLRKDLGLLERALRRNDNDSALVALVEIRRHALVELRKANPSQVNDDRLVRNSSGDRTASEGYFR